MLTAEYPPFRPSFLKGPHAQTIGAYFVRGKMTQHKAEKHIVELIDGDRIVVHDDRPDTWITGDRIAVLFHGLCGCHKSPYMRRIADKLYCNGIRTIRVDMRGFGDSALISKSHLHAGASDDVASVVDFIGKISPLSKVSLIGFSLGGNVVLKTLGHWSDRHPESVDSAIVVSPPVDLLHASWNLRRGGNRIYDKYFMRRMRNLLVYRRKRVEGLIDNDLSPIPKRMLHFDDQFIAPMWGFRGAKEYYESSSAGSLMKHVAVPTILVTSKDDPIVPFEMYDNFEMSRCIDMVVTRHGGHLGFIGRHRGDPDKHWMDWRICRWVASLGNS